MKSSISILKRLSLFAFLFVASSALADTVSVSFSANGFIRAKNGELSSATGSKFVFSKLKFGGDCGTIVKNYNKNGGLNNALPKGTTCTISGVLKRRNGEVVKNSKIEVRNELNTVRTSKLTNANGAFSMSFKVLDDGASYYTILGPKVNTAGSRVGCTIYSYDHAV